LGLPEKMIQTARTTNGDKIKSIISAFIIGGFKNQPQQLMFSSLLKLSLKRVHQNKGGSLIAKATLKCMPCR
jgi:hypothetical protein